MCAYISPLKENNCEQLPVPSLYLHLYLHRHEKVSRARSSSSVPRSPRNCPDFSDTLGLSDIRNSSPAPSQRSKPAARPSWQQEVPGADFARDAPAACKHRADARRRKGTARASKPGLYSVRWAPRLWSSTPRVRSREPRPERNRKRLCCPAPPAPAGARGGGCTGKGGGPREGARRTGGQAGRDGSAAPLELVPFPS